MIELGTLVDYLDYFGWIVVFGGIIASAILFTLGRSAEGRKIIFGTTIGAFILAFGWTIITSTISYQSYNIPGWSDISYAIYAAAAFSVIFAAIELVRGNGREGLGYFLTAIALIFMLNYGPSIFGVNNVNLKPPQVNAVFGIGIPGTSFQLGVPVQWLIDMPSSSQILSIQINGESVYQFTENIAFGVLGIAILGDIIWTLWQKEDVFAMLKDVSKDVAAAVLLIISMPYIYEIFATVINYIANCLIQPVSGTITSMGDSAAALIAGGFAGGYFVPALADTASDILFSLAIAGMLAAIRFFAVAAALVLFPVFMALWVFPPLRGAVKFLIEFVLGMAFSGIIASGIFLTLLSVGTSNAGYATILYLASPVLYGFLPMMISFAGGSGLLSLGTNLLPFKRGRGAGGRGGSGAGQNTPTPVPAGAPAQVGASVGSSKLRTGLGRINMNVSNPPPSPGTKLSQQYGTPSSLSVNSPGPAPVGIISRIRNRESAKISTSAENPVNVPKGYEITSAKEYTDYGPMQAKPTNNNMRITGSDMNNVTAISSLNTEKQGQATVFRETATNLRKKDVEIKETKAHAFAYGVGENLKAGAIMTAQKFGQKMDSWLNAQGINVRPFESIQNKIRETRLRKPGKKRTQTF
ncbi:hypothetical protein [Acidianus manzaensis]|uniref:Uncharacterized protein n=1 Tax=Acidianus manzaensis TaxID=282676 RepID=A0A1W6K0S5_9CREN|nr:hypothetical protein [Acidianus manzaensis]ARM76133.1 hypothetical protein B6F84_08955 [Acidianus manzaensis]